MRRTSRYAIAGAGAMVLAVVIAGVALASGSRRSSGHDESLPVSQMESILQAQGSVIQGVLSVEIDRTDIGTISLHDYATGQDIPIKPSFEVNGDLTFQPIGDDQAFFNGDIALKPNEVDPVIDTILSNNLVFQAEHQHFYDFQPPVWFIHFRGKGDPLTLAREVHNVLKATSVPLPQAPPSNPKTPLNPNKLKRILHGYDAEVGDDGVVTVLVAPPASITIDGVHVEPPTNISTNVAFEPLNSSGTQAAVAPDFALLGSEVNPVMQVMRAANWDIGCLYNQETEEQPQLFFSHQIKTGDPYALAREVRRGLDRTSAP
jgi:hypothetical protein